MEVRPINTVIKLSTCNRCGAYVFFAQSDGLKTAADPAPLDHGGYIAALAAGRRTFDLVEQAGRPHKLLTRGVSSNPPDFRPEARRRPILAEHGCGAKGMDTTKVEATPVDPLRAPVRRGRPKGGLHPQPAPESASQGHTGRSRAPRANPRRSELDPTERVRPRCDVCGKIITTGEPFAGIHHMTWQYAIHQECP